MTLGPVVASSRLTKNKVIRTEYLSVWSRPDGIHGTGFQINENGPGYIFASRSLIVVHVDPLQLEIAVAMVSSSGVNTVFIRDDFPELENEKISITSGIMHESFTVLSIIGTPSLSKTAAWRRSAFASSTLLCVLWLLPAFKKQYMT